MKTILVIEDEQELRESLHDLLETEGFRIFSAENGAIGVQLAQKHVPDLIVCDVQMPDMDGYTVLKTLHQSDATATIPFIFLTARGTKSDLRYGMELGADDYLTKPCTAEELIGAVNSRFEKQATIRAQSQQRLDSLRSNITRHLPHELHTPLNGIISSSQILIQEYDSIERTEVLELAEVIYSSADRLHKLIQNFMVYAELETIAHNPERLAALRNDRTNYPDLIIASIATHLAEQVARETDLCLTLQKGDICISDFNLQKVMQEIIDNAFKFSAPGTQIHISSAIEKDTFVVCVSDLGRGIAAQDIANLGAYMQFDRQFYEQQGAGLGLTIAKRILDLHNGNLIVESVLEKGTTVQAIFPLNPVESSQSAAYSISHAG